MSGNGIKKAANALVSVLLSLIFIMALKTSGEAKTARAFDPRQAQDVEIPLFPLINADLHQPSDVERRVLSAELEKYLLTSNARWTKQDKEDVVDALLDIESKYGFSPNLFLRLMKVESNFKIDAVSGDGAKGLCQIQPETARQISKNIGAVHFSETLLFDPVLNLRLSAEYLHFLETKYKALPKALAAYNMGPGAFSRSYGEGGIPDGKYNRLITE